MLEGGLTALDNPHRTEKLLISTLREGRLTRWEMLDIKGVDIQ